VFLLKWLYRFLMNVPSSLRVLGSSVGVATELRAGRSGNRIPVGARFSVPVQTGPGAHPGSCTMGTGSYPGVKYGRGVTLTPHPLLVPWSWKSRAIPLPTFCNGVPLPFYLHHCKDLEKYEDGIMIIFFVSLDTI
jgi:hypothetical protein